MLEKIGTTFFIGASAKLWIGVGLIVAAPVAYSVLRPIAQQALSYGLSAREGRQPDADRASAEWYTVEVDPNNKQPSGIITPGATAEERRTHHPQAHADTPTVIVKFKAGSST